MLDFLAARERAEEAEKRANAAVARADTLTQANTELVEALSWALDVLEISLKRIDTIDGEHLNERHYAIRTAGLAKAHAALAAATPDTQNTTEAQR